MNRSETMQQPPPVEDEGWKRDLARVFRKMPTNIRQGVYNQMPDDVKAYLDKPPKSYAIIDDDEQIAARAWKEVLEYKGLPLDTPYKPKTYSERCKSVSFSYLESHCDGLYSDLRAKKRNCEAASSSSVPEFVCPLPHHPKPVPPFRVLEESEDEDYTDFVYEQVYGKKRRQLDAEALRKQKLRKPKRFKSHNALVYADEDSIRKRDDKIKAHKEMERQLFKQQQKGNGLTSFFF